VPGPGEKQDEMPNPAKNGRAGRAGQEEHPGLSRQEAEIVEERAHLRPVTVYEIVRREGEEEMRRPAASLWWSGLAGGLSISFSLLAQAILQLHLPDAAWRPLVSSFGYCVGFLMVVLGRQQLFTENTITVVLPVAAELNFANLMRLGRMWSIVLAANIAGTLVAALFCSFAPVLPQDIRDAMLAIGGIMMEKGWFEMLFSAVSAGFLMAAMVWLIPSAEGTEFHVIALMTYLIAIGGFPHIVTGSVESFLLILDGRLGLMPALWQFGLPVLLGNMIGGTALFAVISYAQVAQEM
jgi:formate/nitrite transporter FocA (FNT family)